MHIGLGPSLGDAATMGGGAAFDFYIDSVSGNDLNDGKTLSTPLRTPAALLSAMGTRANLKIAAKYGSIFTQSLVLTSEHIGTKIDA